MKPRKANMAKFKSKNVGGLEIHAQTLLKPEKPTKAMKANFRKCIAHMLTDFKTTYGNLRKPRNQSNCEKHILVNSCPKNSKKLGNATLLKCTSTP